MLGNGAHKINGNMQVEEEATEESLDLSYIDTYDSNDSENIREDLLAEQDTGVPVFVRITREKGWEFVHNLYRQYYQKKTTIFGAIPNISIPEWIFIVFPKLWANRIYVDYHREDKSSVSKAEIGLSCYKTYLRHIESLKCVLVDTCGKQNYPQALIQGGLLDKKGRGGGAYLQLHQYGHYFKYSKFSVPYLSEHAELWIVKGLDVALHPCNHANCIVCAFKATVDENSRRRLCPVFQIINDKLIRVCSCSSRKSRKCSDFSRYYFEQLPDK